MDSRIQRIIHIIRLVTGFIFGILLARCIWILFSLSYEEYIPYLLNLIYKPKGIKYIQYDVLKWGFYGLRLLCVICLLVLVFRMLRAYRKKTPVFSKNEESFYRAIAKSILSNYTYVKQLGVIYKILLSLLLLIQISGYMYLILTLPYHTDEAYSYMHFSGKGFVTAVSIYPLPNNHVFFNAIASFFLALPVDVITAVRLPNLIASCIATYFFLRLANTLFPIGIACICTIIFSFSFPFIFYAFQARGYMLLMLFAIIAFYSYVRIVYRCDVKKYERIYVLATVLGVYTIPTFLYFTFSVSALMFVWYAQDTPNRIMRFFKLHTWIIAGILLCYSPIITLHGNSLIAQTDGVAATKSYSYIFANIWKHVVDTWAFLTADSYMPVSVIIPFLAALVWICFKEALAGKYILACIVLMILSPFPIIILHRVIPFLRTWCFLIIPLCLGIGYILTFLYVLALSAYRYTTAKHLLLFAFLIGWSGAMLARSRHVHRYMLDVDYVVRKYVTLLQNYLPYVHTIDHTNDFSFYLAEDLESEGMKRGNNITLHILQEGDSIQADILVTGKGFVLPIPEQYELIPVTNPYFTLYRRKTQQHYR